MTDQTPECLWQPDQARIERSRMHDFMQWLANNKGLSFDNYNSLWQWSVDHLEDFWIAFWEYFDIRHSAPYTQVLNDYRMPGATWFEGARINMIEQAFRFHEDEPGACDHLPVRDSRAAGAFLG